MATRPKRHHTVPIVHLKHFVGTAPAGQIWTYDKISGVMRSATPENTSVIGDFYSIELADGSINTTVEETLAKVESDAATTYARLVAGEVPVKGRQREDFALFLSLMYLRTTVMRRLSGEVYGRFIQSMSYAYASDPNKFDAIISKFEKDSGKVYSEKEREDLRKFILDPDRYSLLVPKDRAMISMVAAGKLAEILYGMKWSLLSPIHGYFITSDNPVVRVTHPATRSPMRGDQGFKNRSAQVTFPLTPQVLMFMTWNSDAPIVGRIRRERVTDNNALRASDAERYLFAHLKDLRVSRLALQHRHSRPDVETSGFGPPKFAKVEVPRRILHQATRKTP